MADASQVHEVWFNPGWPNQQRLYRGPDSNQAALSYGALAERMGSVGQGWHEIIWTVDGVTHQREQRGVA